MHRHGYKGRKFGRERDQRQALIVGLATSLVTYGKIETTLPKAKEVVPYVEALITKAKKGDLHNRRQILASLSTVEAAHKLVDEIAPKLKGRSSGHLRIVHGKIRVGDGTQMAIVSFVDDITAEEAKPVEKKAAVKAPATKPAVTKKTAVKAEKK